MIRKVSLSIGVLLVVCSSFVPQALADGETVDSPSVEDVDTNSPQPIQLPVANSGDNTIKEPALNISVEVIVPEKNDDTSGETIEDEKIYGFINPVENASVTSSFGYRVHPITGSSKLHAGIDYGSSCGSPVYAPADGEVTLAGWKNATAGNAINIVHESSDVIVVQDGIASPNEESSSNDTETSGNSDVSESSKNGVSSLSAVQSNYNHLSAVHVSVGDKVVQGQFIGYVGTTGGSTGCHLHWETEINGSPVDPTTLLTTDDYGSSVYQGVPEVLPVTNDENDEESAGVEDSDVQE